MINTNTTAANLHPLGEVAHWLLWLGFDRAADEIYAVIEEANADTGQEAAASD